MLERPLMIQNGHSIFVEAVAVMLRSGFAGSVLLLMRNRLAVPAFALSLFGAASNTMVYFTNPPPDGFFNLPLTLFIIGFAIFLLWFTHLMKRRGVIG